MSKEKNFFAEKIDWVNPIKKFSYLLYLADEIFPHDPRLSSYKEAEKVLNSFYCDARVYYGVDVNKLLSFLKTPNEQLLIIEGPVGIGKTWFVRFNLQAKSIPKDENEKPVFHSAVIDLLRAAPDDAEDQIYKQICPALEQYFSIFYSSPKQALTTYATEKYRLRYGIDKSEEQNKRVNLGAAAWVAKWLLYEDGKEYAELLLNALEYLNGPFLFLVVDNVDRISDSDQERLVAIVQRVLRNARIRVIIPLRDTTPLLIDRFRGLNEVRHESMRLSQLDIKKMLKPRFFKTKNGKSLYEYRIKGGHETKEYTFPQLYEKIFNSETGELLENLAGGNCRVALHMTRRLLESNQIKMLENISNSQYAIAALMLSDTSKADPGSYIINLFDNKERREPGNALIRYRVLELLLEEHKINPAHQRIKNYFNRLGYSDKRFRQVLARMMMASIIYSLEGHTPETLLKTDEDEIGVIVLTDTGEAYKKQLLDKLWYYVIAKNDLAPNMPPAKQSYDEKEKYYYITHTGFVEYLKDEERLERGRAKRWDSLHGPKFNRISLDQPHIKAKIKLFREDEGGSNN